MQHYSPARCCHDPSIWEDIPSCADNIMCIQHCDHTTRYEMHLGRKDPVLCSRCFQTASEKHPAMPLLSMKSVQKVRRAVQGKGGRAATIGPQQLRIHLCNHCKYVHLLVAHSSLTTLASCPRNLHAMIPPHLPQPSTLIHKDDQVLLQCSRSRRATASPQSIHASKNKIECWSHDIIHSFACARSTRATPSCPP
jgi:hypothetical protein